MTNGEPFEEIAEDLPNILNLGIQIKSITSERDNSCIKTIKKLVQKCLFNNVYQIYKRCTEYGLQRIRNVNLIMNSNK
jgi:hypothetical protein